ncbi:MAG: DegV family protein [Tissierellia bacterium]|nr:DegV family protein [Tissierellia bacterium]
MKDYEIFTSSPSDLNREYHAKNGIQCIPFKVIFEDKEVDDDTWQTFSPKEFYDLIRQGANPSTSQINVGDYVEHFTPFLEAGKDILHLELSSGISGSINSAQIARAELANRFPERKIYVVDSLCASSGLGLLVDKVVELRDQGKAIDEIYAFVEEHKLNVQHWFTSMDLTHYFRGGRISRTSFLIGGALNICPVLNMDYKGKLTPRKKARGFKKALNSLVDQMSELAEHRKEYDQKVFICQSDEEENAQFVADKIRKTFPYVKEVCIFPIGTTIGSHTGPGTISIFFWGDRRTEDEPKK